MRSYEFNPAGYVTLNLGRRPEGPDDPDEFWYRGGRGGAAPPLHIDGYFRRPTDVAWDSDDNIYISDGYTNSRVAKFDKNGNWVKSWGSRGTGGAHADENPGQFNTPHNIGIDRQNNVYVADRNNRRIQVFDADGNFLALHSPQRHLRQEAAPGARQPAAESARRDAAVDALHHEHADAVSLHVRRRAGPHLQDDARRQDPRHARRVGPRTRSQFNWIHGIACPSENTLLRRRHEQLARAEGAAASRPDQIDGFLQVAAGLRRPEPSSSSACLSSTSRTRRST